MTMMSTLATEERIEKGDHHMTPEKEEEAILMMREDIGIDQTQEIEEATMVPADLAGEGIAGRVSLSRGLLLQAPLLPRDQCC